MPAAADASPIRQTVAPNDEAGVCEAIRSARAEAQAVYPIGGGTSLDFGLVARRPGIGLSLAGVNRIVDYNVRDMTITAEAGTTMAALAETLAAERQRLPIDVPQAERATIGGVVATGWNGPRRYGFGTIRDYVIGIAAVDGRGTLFHGGGRVVKNVAGYDFCKLLTGSLGAIGVISQLTLKLKPAVERSVLVACPVADLKEAERLLAALVTSHTTPAAIELVSGPAWKEAGLPFGNSAAALVVGLEGTEPEVAWMIVQLCREWQSREASIEIIEGNAAARMWSALAEWPAGGSGPLDLQAYLLPSQVAAFCELCRSIDPNCSWQAHAGSGIVIVRFAEFSAGAVSKSLIGTLQPAATRAGGNVVVLRSDASLGELPRQAVWGSRDAAVEVMQSIKRQFDPDDILNPGRFVY